MGSPDFSQFVLLLMPVASSFFVMNFGAQLADVMCMLTVFNAAAAPVIVPALLPWISTGRLEISIPLVTSIAAGIFAGCTASYTSVKRRSFGIKVQGMASGFILSGFTTPLYAGMIRVQLPELMPVLPWAVFGLSLLQGHIIAKLYVKFQHLMVRAI
jgi:hypothetical protein